MPTLYGIDGSKKGTVQLGKAFAEPVRVDLIRRAFLAERSRARQPYSSDPLAGQRTSAHYHGLRHYRYTMMNREMARLTRIHGRVGYLNFTARIAPHARKGRGAHPPQLRDWTEKINRKEWLKAFRSALAATARAELVRARGHTAAELFVVEDRLQTVAKAKELVALLVKLMEPEMDRTKHVRVRGGKATMRGRGRKGKVGPLLIVAEDKGIGRACRSLAGVDCVTAQQLSVSNLAPGGHPGRLCVWTEAGLKAIEERVK